MQEEIILSTSKKQELIDITNQVKNKNIIAIIVVIGLLLMTVLRR